MQKGRRTQFPLTLHIAATIHRIIGNTCTEVGTQLHGDHFRLWSMEQLMVLMTRTRRLSNLYFVGDRDTVTSAIQSVFFKRSHWIGYMTKLVERLANHGANAAHRDFQISPYLPYYTTVPRAPLGYVFVLVSNDGTRTLVDHHIDVVRRLQELNQGAEVDVNMGHRNWSILALITGFQSEEGDPDLQRRVACSRLKHRIGDVHGTPAEIMQIVQDVIADLNDPANRQSFNDFKLTIFNADILENSGEITKFARCLELRSKHRAPKAQNFKPFFLLLV